MTKELKKNYSLLAAAAMKAMTPEYKFALKKRFNNTNIAIKALRKSKKQLKQSMDQLQREDSMIKLTSGIDLLHFLLKIVVLLYCLQLWAWNTLYEC